MFKFEILENIDYVEDKSQSKKIILELEQYYLDLYKSYNPKNGYNVCKDSKNCLGVRRSRETRQKISDIQKGRKLMMKKLEIN